MNIDQNDQPLFERVVVAVVAAIYANPTNSHWVDSKGEFKVDDITEAGMKQAESVINAKKGMEK